MRKHLGQKLGKDGCMHSLYRGEHLKQRYSGCYIRASINIYPFNANGNRGIAAGLSNIQFWEDGEPLNGRVRAEDEFDALDDDDADDFLD